MKKAAKILLILFAAVIVVGAGGFLYIKSLPVPELPVQTPDLQFVKDGSFVATCENGPVKATVEVEVKDHQISEIKLLEHQNGLGGKAENILETVTTAQSLDVDTVAGATHSSRVILKAVEQALLKGLES